MSLQYRNRNFFIALIRSIFSPLYFSVLFIYLETVFRIAEKISGANLFPALFAIPFGILCGFFADLFPEKASRKVRYIISILVIVIFGTQVVYHDAFTSYMSWSQSGTGVAVFTNFLTACLVSIWNSIITLIFMFLPLVGLHFLHKYLRPENDLYWKRSVTQILAFVLADFLVVICLPLSGKEAHTPYDIYHDNWNLDLSIWKLGVLSTTKIDVKKWLFDDGSQDPGLSTIGDIDTEAPITRAKDPKAPDNIDSVLTTIDFSALAEQETDVSVKAVYSHLASLSATVSTASLTEDSFTSLLGNINDIDAYAASQTDESLKILWAYFLELNPDKKQSTDDSSPDNIIADLDFKALAEQADDKNIKEVFQYFANLTPTKKNDFTGMFRDYNLVMFCAESFSSVAINKTLTPTLYKLSHEGFVFDNFWTIYPSNTTNGEYSLLTGLMPDLEKPKTDGSFYYTVKSDIAMNLTTLPAYFNAAGCTSRAYHPHTGTYYHRDETHTHMGFAFKGSEAINQTATEKLSGWPESDLVAVQQTVGEYINDDRFFAYYMTVSGHHNYKFGSEYNDIATKNRAVVDAYCAANEPNMSESCRAYLACNIELDRALGYLIEQLRSAGKLSKTVICLCPDHYPYGLTDKEYKEMIGHSLRYDALERWKNTLILWNSDMEPVNISKPCCTVDVLPTLLNLFGFDYDSRLYAGQDILSDSYGLAFTTEQCFITNKMVYHARYGSKHKLDPEFSITDDYLNTYITVVRNRFRISAAILNYDVYDLLPKQVMQSAAAR